MSPTAKERAQVLDDLDETSASFRPDGLSTNVCEEDKLMQNNYQMAAIKLTDSPDVCKWWQPRPSLVVHILVTIFGVSAWIGVNGLFIQLPLLTNTAPERWGLAACLVVTIQVANIAPITYSLFKKSKLLKINEFYCILGMLGTETIVMGLLAIWYDKTSVIAGKEHSTALFVLTFFIAAVSCSSSVLFMPYLRNFKEIYLISYFIGEGLSGVLPSIVALIQGISESPECTSTNVTAESNDTFPRFPPEHYFLFLLMSLFFSLAAFCLLEKLPYIKNEKISTKQSSIESINHKDEKCHCQRQISVLTEGSISENDTEKHICIENYKKTDGEILNVYYTQSKEHLTFKDVYLYTLLSVICLLANGFLPGLQPYSCLSYGNMTYHLSVTLSQIANPTACLLALWFLPQSKMIINSFSGIIFIASAYVLFLSLTSPNPPLQDSKVGAALAIFSWILLVGLISYVKLLITSVFRRKSEKKLFPVGVVMQAGSALGAVLSFILINYTSLLHEYESKPCNTK